jgi:gamma-glutamylcyclotransferase (GGCT)/AIG2-like uncharacterized protein YtfP
MPHLKVFVYGTLKPGEANYQTFCAHKVVKAQSGIVRGLLFALPFGYPAMTPGDLPVRGFLLSFSDSDVLNRLDWLEDYDPHRPASENEYNRREVQVYNPAWQPLGWAWTYMMTPEQANRLGGVLLTDGWWSHLTGGPYCG